MRETCTGQQLVHFAKELHRTASESLACSTPQAPQAAHTTRQPLWSTGDNYTEEHVSAPWQPSGWRKNIVGHPCYDPQKVRPLLASTCDPVKPSG